MIVELTIADAEFVAYELAKAMVSTGEPLPPFSSRYPNRLEAVLNAPFAGYADQEKYPSLTEKASVLFYTACKDHPFENGNKRMAVVLTFVFLNINGLDLVAPPLKLYDLATQVTESDPADQVAVLRQITIFVDEYTMEVSDEQAQMPSAA